MLQICDLVRFFDYDECATNRGHDTHDDYWRYGIVTEIPHNPWDDDWDPSCLPCVVVTSNCHSQPIVMPDKHNIGTWVEVISEGG